MLTLSTLTPNRIASAAHPIACIHIGVPSEAKAWTPLFVGVAKDAYNSYGLSLQLITLPGSGRETQNSVANIETSLYILSGRIEIRYGLDFENRIFAEAGDFLYIPTHTPYSTRNLSESEPVLALTAQTQDAAATKAFQKTLFAFRSAA